MLDGLYSATEKTYRRKNASTRNKEEVIEVYNNIEGFCKKSKEELMSGAYKMGKYRHFRLVHNDKERYISVAPFADRCIQNSIKDSIEPVLIGLMTDDMLAGLPNRGIKSHIRTYSAVDRVRDLFNNPRNRYCLPIDIRKCYDNIDKHVLWRIIQGRIHDKRMLALLNKYLFASKTLPIGDPMSHFLCNVVIEKLMRYIKCVHPSLQIVNYADDFLLFARDKAELWAAFKDMRHYAAKELRLHFKAGYIRPLSIKEGVVWCGRKYKIGCVLLTKRNKTAYIKSRHKKRSLAAYNGILQSCDSKHLRWIVEQNDNKMEKIRRPFAGKKMNIETLVGIKHAIVDKAEQKSRQQHSDTYYHVQAIADGLGLIVYTTSSRQLVEVLRNNDLPLRDMTIAKDYSGYYYEGTVLTDKEEEELIRQKYNL